MKASKYKIFPLTTGNRLLFILVLFLGAFRSNAQADTTIYYLDSAGDICAKDTAAYKAIRFFKENTWFRNDYNIEDGLLVFAGAYLDKETKIKEGVCTLFYTNGKPKKIITYQNGRTLSFTGFYENGSKKSVVDFETGKQTAWDEHGTKIKNYIVEREAVPGEQWAKFLDENLNPLVASNTNDVYTRYEVEVSFTIDTSGALMNIKLVSVYPPCKSCGDEALRALNASPSWFPAIKDNKRVISNFKQLIIFGRGKSQVEKYAKIDLW